MDIIMEGYMVIRQFPTQHGGFPATDIIPKAEKTYHMVITAEGKNWKPK